MSRSHWQAVVLSGLFLGVLSGNWNDTSTGIDLRKLHQFPLTKIRSGPLKPGSRLTFDGITATKIANDNEVRLRGSGKSGKEWEVQIHALDEVWRGDLDGNGVQDYVFFNGGPYINGRLAPPFSLEILLMDSEEMPTPLFTTLYHGEDGGGIRNLVDLQHDGHAELLDSNYDEDPSDPYVGPQCSGHWVTQLYRFDNLRVEEIRDAIGGIIFPLIHNWSYRGTECPKLEKPFGPVQPVDPTPRPTARLNALILNVDQLGAIKTQPAFGCNEMYLSTIIYDRPQIRVIAFPNPFGEYPKALTNRIHRDGARVQLRGLYKSLAPNQCSVEVLWAQ